MEFAELRQTCPNVVCLFGTVSVVQDGQIHRVPEGCKKLLALVALQGGTVDRRFAAGSLWPDGSDDRAAGNLRSALWRLRGAGICLMDSDKASIFLRDSTTTDLGVLCAWTDRLIAGNSTDADVTGLDWTHAVGELLPGWYEDWVVFERESVRQRMLHALESLSGVLCNAERYGEAIIVAIEAIAMEPSRESAHRVLAGAHLAEGNCFEARRAYFRCRDLLRTELDVEPTEAFQDWVNRWCHVSS